MKKSLPIVLLSFALFLAGCVSSGEEEKQSGEVDSTLILSTNKDFENVFFDSKTLIYDGESHILDEVRGAPEGTQITYIGRETHVDAGTYTASALLTKEGYNNKTLTATLTIAEASFENITFSDEAFEYDGQVHSIYVSGAPSFASVTYSNNGKTNVGTYIVTATIEAANYETMIKTATLSIVGKQITGVTIEDKEFQYDGKPHSLEVSGEIPLGVSVAYSNNGKTNSGSYTVTAKLSGTGYESLTLTAKLTITPIELPDSGYFYSKAYIYDGQDHSIYVDSAPSGATITYQCLNASGTNTFKNIGVYEIEATVKSDINHLSKKYATLTITTPATASIDSSKTPLAIDENLKWDPFYDALEDGNFTMKGFAGSYDVEHVDDAAPTDLFDDAFEGHTSGYLFASNGKEAFQHSRSLINSDSINFYDFYKENGNDIIHLEFDDQTNEGTIVKFPKQAFKETVTYSYASNAFASLTKGENGEFLAGIDGDDYYKNVGIPYIDNGVFTVLMQHPRVISTGYRYFYEIVKFYNIGNTIVEVPSDYLPSKGHIDTKMGIDKFCLDGVEYGTETFRTASSFDYYYTAQLYVDYHRAIFLKPGTYTVLPTIYDRVVEAIVYTNSYYSYNNGQSGYNFRLYVDSNGVYQGEYSDYESLARFTIDSFLDNGGTIEYYDQWND
ncbi:MAG: MBG domain-containing protein [Candidatus Enteromonas sp.]|nr:MBG domain-containing protein [Candidatus Enteromonas sp.]